MKRVGSLLMGLEELVLGKKVWETASSGIIVDKSTLVFT